MSFNTSIIKKKKSHGMEESEPKEKYEISKSLETYSPKNSYTKGLSAKTIPLDMEGIKTKPLPLDMKGLSAKTIPLDMEGLKTKPIPLDLKGLETNSLYGGKKSPKKEQSLKLDALIKAAAKKELPIKASVEKEVEISSKKEEASPKKPSEFIQYGGSLLQHLKKKK